MQHDGGETVPAAGDVDADDAAPSADLAALRARVEALPEVDLAVRAAAFDQVNADLVAALRAVDDG